MGLSPLNWLAGNINTDPLFVDAANDDYHLSSISKCLPANNWCGALIGALGEGCGPVSLEPLSWARIKAGYR